ncbi:MAG: phenylalanine--tRNA ligase subunit beta [Syntrophomonadaceae bacterium]|nr:phenylalanine--tRNA ligase subunit beta [Syntrophomonadaceae bacterium]
MRVPLTWLKEYVDIKISPEELARRLTMAGITVENIDKLSTQEVVLELELTPNRADCLSLFNVAREVAAVTGEKLHLPEVIVPETEERIEDLAGVEIEAPALCDRYLARVIRNIRIAPSPLWMQERLQAAGIRPINNIVDITNYVMLETGQPLHAFDYDTLTDHQIIVRQARPGETLNTLDKTKRELTQEMLVIADSQRPVALAGVMGGLETEVTERTQTVLLESAHFDRVSIRRTSRQLGLRSESSIRFEKGTDIEGVVLGANRAAQLMAELGAGQPVAGVIDRHLNPRQPHSISLRISRTNSLLGTDLSQSEVINLLDRLQLKLVIKDHDSVVVEVPSYRGDLEREEDLIEEIARLHGYDRIPITLPSGTTTQGMKTTRQKAVDRTRDLLTACGLTEVVTFSMVSPRVFDRIGLAADDPLRRVMVLANPLNEEQSVLRTTLIPNLLEVAARNYNRRVTDVAVFELGRVFLPAEDGNPGVLPDEKLYVAGLTMGDLLPGWSASPQPMDFFYLKGVVEELLTGLGIKDCAWQAATLRPTFHPGRSAEIYGAGELLGLIAEIHPDVLEEYGLPKRTWVFELNLDQVLAVMSPVKSYSPLSRYPSVQRDLALIIPESLPAAKVETKIWESGQPLLHQVTLFDVYQGKPIPEGYRSLAYSLIYQASDRTLTDEEVNERHQLVRDTLSREMGVELR